MSTHGQWIVSARTHPTDSDATIWIVYRSTTHPSGYVSDDFMRMPDMRIAAFHSEADAKAAIAAWEKS